MNVIEDVVSHVGSGHEAEPYVNLIRGVDPEHVQTLIAIAESRGREQGRRDGIAYAEFKAKREMADAVRRAERRVHREYRSRSRSTRFSIVACVAILVVMACALLWLSVQS